MEHVLDKLEMRLRDAAHRAGLPRFWTWWIGELAPLVPAAPRSEIQRRRTRPILEFCDGEAILWTPQLKDGNVTLVQAARIDLSGDSASVAAAGRDAIAALAPYGSSTQSTAPRIVVALAPRQVLRKELVLPAAVEEDLRRTLAYDLDRHTPFRQEQLYFDVAVVGRDLANRTIRVQWAAALRNVVDAARKQAEDWGAVVVAVVPGPAAMGRQKLNLLPAEGRPRPRLWRRWQVWAPMALVAIVALAAVLVPLAQKRDYTVALLGQTEEARVQAEGADALRREFERQQNDYNYVLAKKYSWPGTIQILDDVTRVLPDDTWITQLEMKTTVKGKDIQREVFMRGESANGGRLISLLEDSRLVDQVVLRSPTTKLQPGPGEVFDLGGVLRASTPPVQRAAEANAPSSAPVSATVAPTTTPPPAPPAPPATPPPATLPPATLPPAPLPPPATPPPAVPAPTAPPARAAATPANAAAAPTPGSGSKP